MKRYMIVVLLFIFATSLVLGGCRGSIRQYENATYITLADDEISVNSGDGVTTSNDIIYYPEGKDFTFGEGTDEDAHSKEEADRHTVVNIKKAGTYVLSGKMSYGQIAVDLGEEAEDNPDARVTLVMNGVDINCSVAPAVIFYNVYECSDDDEENASKDVDTTNAGANIIIADGTVNNISGSYVAKIYKSVELNEDGTEVIDSEKLHKYDGAFYSKMSMNIDGGEKNDGVLNIKADNEGICSELHLAINGGNINIESGNDGINTNEDYVSVTTLNGGNVNIVVNGSTGEGDGIDSNGWLVINGGSLTSSACGFSGDAGIDSDMGIHINGGELAASGNMLDRISDGDATFIVFEFAESQKAGKTYTLKNENGEIVKEWTPANDFSNLVVSSKEIEEGSYTLWCGESQLSAAKGGRGNGFGGHGGPPPMEDKPQNFDGAERKGFNPADMPKPEGEMPDGERMPRPDGEMSEGERMPRPEGEMPGHDREGMRFENLETSTEFVITKGENYFSFVAE